MSFNFNLFNKNTGKPPFNAPENKRTVREGLKDKAIHEAALIFAERELLGEPQKESLYSVKNGYEDQEMHYKAKRNREKEERKVEIIAKAKEIELTLRKFFDDIERPINGRTSNLAETILTAENPGERLAYEYEASNYGKERVA